MSIMTSSIFMVGLQTQLNILPRRRQPGLHPHRAYLCDLPHGNSALHRFPNSLVWMSLSTSHRDARSGGTFEHSCLYGTFKKFGDFWFPREIGCFEDKHKTIEAKVAELTSEVSIDPALFTAPPEAIELGMCSETTSPPIAVSTRDPVPPFGSRYDNTSVTVVLSLVIDTKGKPQNVTVLRSGRKNYDESALSAVRAWRFKPATCNGEPMPVQINVEVGFRLYH